MLHAAPGWGKSSTNSCETASCIKAIIGDFGNGETNIGPSLSVRVSCSTGKPVMTDGPFAETEEGIGGCA